MTRQDILATPDSYNRERSRDMRPSKVTTPATPSDRLIPLALFAALTLATLIVLSNFPKYRIAGNELLSNSTVETDLTSWETIGKSRAFSHHQNTVILTQQSAKQSSRLSQHIKIDELADAYLVTAQLGSNNIVAGAEDWQNGAVVVVRTDKNNKRIGSYEIAGIQGTQEISEYKKFIELPAPTTNITVTARLLNATGELLVGSISLKPAVKQAAYPTLRIILIASWVSISGMLILLHLRRFGITTPFIILCSIAALAFIGTLMPKQFAIELNASIANLMPEQFSAALKQTFNHFFPGYIGHANQEISKFGHWLAFFCLTLAAVLFLQRTSIYYIIASTLLLAAATETLQFLTSARTPHIYDFIIDASGVFVGLVVALPIRRLAKKKLSA